MSLSPTLFGLTLPGLLASVNVAGSLSLMVSPISVAGFKDQVGVPRALPTGGDKGGWTGMCLLVLGAVCFLVLGSAYLSCQKLEAADPRCLAVSFFLGTFFVPFCCYDMKDRSEFSGSL